MIRTSFDLTGMGGGYEGMCQRMLWRGVKYLEALKPDPKMWEGSKEYQNIYGVMITEGQELKLLESAMMPQDDNDCTGAMHQCVMGHLRYIHKHGLPAWEAELRPHRPGNEEFQFDDEKMQTVEFPLETDLSRQMEYRNS